MQAAMTPSHHASSSLEKVLEHRLLAALTTKLWCRGTRDLEVLRAEVDAHGYDLVLEANGILRHIQLKAMIVGGKRRDVGISLALARKPSGCVVWMIYDPATLELGPFLWFGGLPGDPLPSLGNRTVRHTKGDALGIKAERSGHRLVARSRFRTLGDIGDLADALFASPGAAGVAGLDQRQLIAEQLRGVESLDGPLWLERVRNGDFDVIPADLTFDDSVEFAHLINGYELVERAGWGDPIAFADARLQTASARAWWQGGPAELWGSLFLEHRRWRMAGRDPDPQQMGLLNRLCRQLRASLV